MKGFTSMMLVGLGLATVAMALPGFDPKKLHLEMKKDELRHVFQAESHEIPDYEVVSLETPRLHRRSSNFGTRIRLNAFGKDIYLWLYPTDGNLASYDTPVYLAKSSMDTATGVYFEKLYNPMNRVGRMLEDREKQATFIFRNNEAGRSSISGNVVSEGWVVRPLPTRFYDRIDFGEKSMNFSNFTREEYHEPQPHIIYKNPKLLEAAGKISQPDQNNFSVNKTSRLKRSIFANIIYPEILVVADYATFRRHGQNVYDLLAYLLPFWNGVDLRYRSLEFPKVRLNIAGIVIATDWTALSYMERNTLESNIVNINGALHDFGLFLPREQETFPFPSSYDIAVTMSPNVMCWVKKDGGREYGILGLAYMRGACMVEGPKSFSVAMFNDRGGFDGMATAAHELGHLFGSDHDGDVDSLCDGQSGHIMAATPVLTENSADWSPCSLSAFDEFFNYDSPRCLFNKPLMSSPMPRVLPGKLMTLDEQCAEIEGTRWCKSSDNPCMRLKCVYSKDPKSCISVGDGAADGTTCDHNKICVHGKCINVLL